MPSEMTRTVFSTVGGSFYEVDWIHMRLKRLLGTRPIHKRLVKNNSWMSIENAGAIVVGQRALFLCRDSKELLTSKVLAVDHEWFEEPLLDFLYLTVEKMLCRGDDGCVAEFLSQFDEETPMLLLIGSLTSTLPYAKRPETLKQRARVCAVVRKLNPDRVDELLQGLEA